MNRKMLVTLDGSELAEVVFTYATELAGRLDIDVILLHVSNPAAREFLPMYQAYVERAADIVRNQARKVQETTGMPSDAQQVEVRGEYVAGYPAEEILRYADENKVDIILMATHGRSGLRRWVMGNVADKVLRASKVPVWLVRAGVPEEVTFDKWPSRTIIVPLDGSELAESVLHYAVALAQQRSSEPVDVVLLRVCEPPTTPSYYVPELPEAPLDWGEFMNQETKRCKKVAAEYLAKMEQRFKDKNISVRSEVLIGRAGDEIVDYANKTPYTIIVMITHGRSGISRWVYGSVAGNVLEGVSGPVVLAKAQ